MDDPRSEKKLFLSSRNAPFVVDCEDAGDSKGDSTTVSTLVSSTARERRVDETITRSNNNRPFTVLFFQFSYTNCLFRLNGKITYIITKR